MSDSNTVQKLATELSEQPENLTTWLALCQALSEHELFEDKVEKHFLALGMSASELGAVALATACATWLRQHKYDKSGRALVSAIADRYGAAAKLPRGRHTVPPKPPLPRTPTDKSESEPAEVSKKQLKELVEEAVKKAVASAENRAPEEASNSILLGSVDKADIPQFIDDIVLRRYQAGEVVIAPGDPADNLYWIASGEVLVTRLGKDLATLSENSVFGESVLLNGARHSSKVTAVEGAWILSLPRKSLDTWTSKAPNMPARLGHLFRTRILSNVMKTSPIFSRLSSEEQADIPGKFSVEIYNAEQKLLVEDAENDRLYVVASGKLQVLRQNKVIAELGPGDSAGEISLLTKKAASATVKATEASVVLWLSRESFDAMALSHPALLAEVYRVLRERDEPDHMIYDAGDSIVNLSAP